MPRIRKTAAQMVQEERQNRERLFIGTLNKYRMAAGFLSWKLAAPYLMMSEATLFRRMKNPETFTLEELHRIIKVLRIPKEEISDFVFS